MITENTLTKGVKQEQVGQGENVNIQHAAEKPTEAIITGQKTHACSIQLRSCTPQFDTSYPW